MRTLIKPEESMHVRSTEFLSDEMHTNVRRNARRLQSPSEEVRHYVAGAYLALLDYFNSDDLVPTRLYDLLYRHDQRNNPRDANFGDEVRKHVRSLYAKEPTKTPATKLKSEEWLARDEAGRKIGRKQIIKLAGEVTVGTRTALILESDYYRPVTVQSHGKVEDARLEDLRWRQRGIAGIIVPVSTRVERVSSRSAITQFELHYDLPLSEAQVDTSIDETRGLLPAA